MIWDITSSVLRVGLTMLVIYKLAWFRDASNMAERIGLGMLGGCSFLTVPSIWDRAASPFDGWSTTVMSAGVLLFVGGRTFRDRKHAMRNEEQTNQARAYLQARGKL